MDDGKKRIEKIRNEEIRATAGVANISEKIREAKPENMEIENLMHQPQIGKRAKKKECRLTWQYLQGSQTWQSEPVPRSSS